MLKEAVLSFKNNLQNKSRNPFWGTFAVVWLIQNWVLIYSLFNFKDSKGLQARVDYIQNYFSTNPILHTTLNTIWITFVALTVSYILVNIARAIINFFEKTVTPWVYQVTDKSSIVLKTDYENLRQRTVRLNDKLREETQKRVRIQEERDNLEDQIAEIISEEEDNSTEETPNNNQVQSTDHSHLERLVNDLKKDGQVENFDKIVTKLSLGEDLKPSDPFEYFSKKGIIKFEKKYRRQNELRYIFELSKIGQRLREVLI